MGWPADGWPEVSWRAWSAWRGEHLSDVPDQGRRGTCLAFATTAAHELERGKAEPLSVEYLFWAAKQADGIPDIDATTTLAISEALSRRGQPVATTWPYQSRLRWPPGPSYQPPRPLGECFARSTASCAPSRAAIRSVVQSAAPCVVVLQLTRGFLKPMGGFVTDEGSDTALPTHHAVVCLAIGESSSLGETFLIRNSWGSAWGRFGYVAMTGSYMDRVVRGAFRFDVGLSRVV
jgi:hypothetical protein